MAMRLKPIIWLLLVISSLFVFSEHVHAAPRIALVIGNGAYGVGPLSDPPNDAALIAETLRGLGFTVAESTNVDQKTMKRLIRNFGSKLKAQKNAVGLFYYSGHGMQVAGRNYMIPVGVTIRDEGDVSIEGVGVDEVLTKMRYAGNGINLVILDACRDNPFEKNFKSSAKGLKLMDAPKGTLIAFAAEPGKVALQGSGKYSYFTESLAQAIVKPGISAIEMLREVRKAVYDNTGGKQLPVVEDRLLSGYYFAPQSVSTSKLSTFKPSVSQTGAPLPENANRHSEGYDFFEFNGISYTSSRSEIIREFGEPDPLDEAIKAARRGLKMSDKRKPTDSLIYEYYGLTFDLSDDLKVTSIEMDNWYGLAKARLKKAGIIDSKINLIGKSEKEILKLLGSPRNTHEFNSLWRHLNYQFRDEANVYAMVRIRIDKLEDLCKQIYVRWTSVNWYP